VSDFFDELTVVADVLDAAGLDELELELELLVAPQPRPSAEVPIAASSAAERRSEVEIKEPSFLS